MRIESIRIENLASLRGVQEPIELRGPVLGDAGLIAVTGPTGAGKTTIFDAVCLALFDETPRTRGRGRDPRELLSRGAGEAVVELVLRLDDGSHWRAEWGVHRARNQAGGPLQASRQRIVDAGTGAVLAEGKKPVQALVEKSLGLSFDQFTSVVLIAQGQFAKFLEASDTERSALLERLTGSEIYSELSRAAYERARLLEEKVSQIDAVLQRVEGLSEEERQRLEAELTRLQEEVQIQRQEVEKAAHKAARLADLLELLARRQEAGQRLEAASAAVLAAADREKRRRDAERAEIAAPALRQAEDLRRRSSVAETQRQQHQEAEREACRRLEASAERLERRWHELLAHLRGAQAEATRRQAFGTIEGETFDRLRGLLRERLQAQEQARRRQQEAAQAEADVETGRAENLTAAENSREQQRQVQLRRQEQVRLGQEIAEVGRNQTREFWAQRRDRWRQAVELAEELVRLDLVALETENKKAREQVSQREQAYNAARQAAASARQAREQQEALLRLASGNADLAEHRDVLQPGEPCPLCGALEHPWASRPAAEDQGILRQARADLEAKKISERSAEASLGAAGAEHQKVLLQAERTKARLESAVQQVNNARHRWLELRLLLPELPAEPVGAARSFAAELPEIDHRLGELDRLLPAQEEARRQLALAERQAAVLEQAQAVAEERLEAAERRRSESAAALGEAAEEELETKKAYLTLAGELAERLGLPLGPDEKAFLASLENELASWQQARQRREQLESLAQRLQRRRPPQEAPGEAEGSAPAEGPGDPATLEKNLEQEIDLENAAKESCRLEEDRRQRAENEVETLGHQLAEAEKALAAAVAEQGFSTEAELRAALLSPAELAELRRQLEELHKEKERHETRLQGLEQELAELGKKFEPSENFEQLRQDPATAKELADRELKEQKDQETGLMAAILDVSSRLQSEKNRRAERDKLEIELKTAREHHELAARLSALIGQKDGGKFRRFAQQLNLDLLLELANIRLDRLAPRYQLARLGDSLDLEVLDREMADERRPVNTLSGGESFLVSLALALALADLRRGSLRLGTLFLDEGFGSLDEATLDTALSVLEQLQADQNTQILIISHVGALKERIDHRIDIQKLGGGRSKLQILGSPS